MTKLHNDELPSVKAADLVNCVVLASVYRYEQFVSYRSITGHGKMLTADLRNIHTLGKHENANKTLTRTLSLTLFTRCKVRIFFGGRNYWVLVPEAANVSLLTG